jgi:hypothetical protein
MFAIRSDTPVKKLPPTGETKQNTSTTVPSTPASNAIKPSSSFNIGDKLIVPYFINKHGTIKPPHRQIVLWKTIMLYLGPTPEDHLKLRWLCRMFRDALPKPSFLWTTFPHPKHSSLKSLMNRINELHKIEIERLKITHENHLSQLMSNFAIHDFLEAHTTGPALLFIDKGIHHLDHYNERRGQRNYLTIKHPLSIIGADRDECVLMGGIEIKGKRNHEVVIKNLTLKQSLGDGIIAYSHSSVVGDNLLIDQATRLGVDVKDTTCTLIDCEVKNSVFCGVYATDNGVIKIKGEKTMIHHNSTDARSDGYGIYASSKSSMIEIYSPLQVEKIAVNNINGQNIRCRTNLSGVKNITHIPKVDSKIQLNQVTNCKKVLPFKRINVADVQPYLLNLRDDD